MKRTLYLKLAWSGMRKNRRLFVPYLLTCVGMVMMTYIIAYLVYSPVLIGARGGNNLMMILSLGRIVVGVFSLLLLLYSSIFLQRRRQKEFGLYNILGMRKRDVARILVWESLLTYLAALLAGLALGMLFSKLAELLLLRIIRGEVGYALRLSAHGVAETAVIFGAIFLLILLVSLARLRLSSPLQLLRSEAVGEKPPKANWAIALLGALLLLAAYAVAVSSIQDPVTAMLAFFIAVLAVILATYLLFIAGSVALCRLLQKRRGYYYRASHFVSVSSMAYRMKRNGAGLASICILSTMVLVMLSSTSCLFIGGENALARQYPYDLSLTLRFREGEDATPQTLEKLRGTVLSVSDGSETETAFYTAVTLSGMLGEGGELRFWRGENENYFSLQQRARLLVITVLSLEDYRRLGGEGEAPGEGELLVYSDGKPYPYPALSFGDGLDFKVTGRLDSFPTLGGYQDTSADNCYFVTADFDAFRETLSAAARRAEQASFAVMLPEYAQYGCFNTTADEQTQAQMLDALYQGSHALMFDPEVGELLGVSVAARAEARSDFLTLNGSLFFLGILLSLVFMSAAVLIIYYKQVSEGYEDVGRFDIMQKVGMTKADIRRSINAQVRTVFFAPLLLAGLHLCFAFPLIWKILRMCGIRNLSLLLGTNVLCFLVFALFYIVVYRVTARVYYHIVSGVRPD